MEKKPIDLKREDLQEYAKAVAFMAETKSSNIFLNSGEEHALLVFSNIFRNSQKVVQLLAGNLSNNVTEADEYQEAIVSFLRKPNSRLEILLDRYEDGKKSKDASLF